MLFRGEALHLYSDLGYHHLRDAQINPRNRIESLDRPSPVLLTHGEAPTTALLSGLPRWRLVPFDCHLGSLVPCWGGLGFLRSAGQSQALGDLLIKGLDLVLQKVEVSQMLAEDKPMRLSQISLHRLGQLLLFAAQFATG